MGIQQGSHGIDAIIVREGKGSDLPGIQLMFQEQLGREPNVPLITSALEEYPSVVALDATGIIIGFAYCGYMSPDLVELMNIAVHADYRSTGLGTRLIMSLEGFLKDQYAAIMLTNSTLYKGDGKKRSASNFYLRNGYSLVASTAHTNLFWKELS